MSKASGKHIANSAKTATIAKEDGDPTKRGCAPATHVARSRRTKWKTEKEK